jgi:hypothetical protein
MASISVIAIPVILETAPQPSLLYCQWAHVYHHGHIILPGMAVAILALYVCAAIREKSLHRLRTTLLLIAGVVTICMVPFTWLFMLPINNILFGLGAETASGSSSSMAEAKELVRVWSHLHLVRSTFPLIGALIGLSSMR